MIKFLLLFLTLSSVNADWASMDKDSCAVRTSAQHVVSLAMNQHIDPLQVVADIAGHTLQQAGAATIGELRADGTVTTATQVLLHAPNAALGEAVRSLPRGDDVTRRMVWASCGAMTAETLAHMLVDPSQKAGELLRANPEMSDTELASALRREMDSSCHAAHLLTAASALMWGDPRAVDVVSQSAGIALDHNFAGRALIAVAKAAKDAAIKSFNRFCIRFCIRAKGGRVGTDEALRLIQKKTTSPESMKAYVREVEKVSGTKVSEGAREKLADAVRRNKYEKIAGDELKTHREPFTRSFKDRLISEWEKNTGKAWPSFEKTNPVTGAKQMEKYQAHHIIPQQL